MLTTPLAELARIPIVSRSVSLTMDGTCFRSNIREWTESEENARINSGRGRLGLVVDGGCVVAPTRQS